MNALKTTSFLTIIFLLSSSLSTNFEPLIFEQSPPIALAYSVQKVAVPQNNHDLSVRIKFLKDFEEKELTIYTGKTASLLLKDDGVYPNETAGDYIFSAFSEQAAASFLQEVLERQQRLIDQKNIIEFTGHLARMVNTEGMELFDKEAFSNFQSVNLSPLLLSQNNCSSASDIRKEKSLFITELKVVEDPNSTYNLVNGTGNPICAWTFGELMKNMAGGLSPNATVAKLLHINQFLKHWILSLSQVYTVNGHSSVARAPTFSKLIQPWLTTALGGSVDESK